MSGTALPADLSPAASLIVFRKGAVQPEILMIRRSTHLAFAGGAAVFPGGRVDPGDEELAATMTGDHGWNAARITAIRETLEETGLLVGVDGPVSAEAAHMARDALSRGTPFAEILEKAGLCIKADALIPFARWYPPTNVARKFDTRFLITDVGTGAVDLSADGSETTGHFWATAKAVLELAEQGAEKMLFPTRMNLLRLAGFDDFSAASRNALAHPPAPLTGIVEERDGETWIRLPDGCGYPPFAEPAKRARGNS